MEQLSISILLFLLFPLGLLLLKLLIRPSASSSKPNLKLPPGPWTLPIIGSLHHLLGSLPHRVMRDLSKTYGPLILLRLGEVPTLIVSSAEAAKHIMKTNDITFASRYLSVTIGIFSYGGRDILFAPYGDNWRQLRKICVSELMSLKRVQSFQYIREQEVANLIRFINSNASEPVNLSERITVFINDTIVRAAIGDRCKQQDEYLHSLDEAVRLTAGFNLADLYPSSSIVQLLSKAARDMKRCHWRMRHILESIIEDRNISKQGDATGDEMEDLLGVLLKLQKQGGLQVEFTADIISAVIVDVFSAGSETSSTTFIWAMSELARNPRVMQKAQSEVREVLKGNTKITEDDLVNLNYLRLVLKETLRLHPPAPLLLPRECRETCQVMGYDIPKGTVVYVNAWAMGRDPKYWEDAEEFKPERFEGTIVDFKGNDFEFIPFGAGRRICPGMSLGLANMELALASLLYHFDWELPNGRKPHELDMAEAFGITAGRRSKLWLCAVPRIPYPPPVVDSM